MAASSSSDRDSRVTLEGITKSLIVSVKKSTPPFDFQRNWGSADLTFRFSCNKKKCGMRRKVVVHLGDYYHRTISIECPECKESSVQFTVCYFSLRMLSDSTDGASEMEIAKIQLNPKSAKLRACGIVERVHTLFQGRTETRNEENKQAKLLLR